MKKAAKQYTIRNIPDRVDRVLRQRARELGKSFNQVALEALVSGAGEALRPKRDFSEIVGSLSEKEATKIDEEIRLQRQIDEKMWKA
jgi:plasmid stability protein